MPLAELAATAFATLFVAFGPVETAAVFGGLTAGVPRPARYRLAWQAVLLAGVVKRSDVGLLGRSWGGLFGQQRHQLVA